MGGQIDRLSQLIGRMQLATGKWDVLRFECSGPRAKTIFASEPKINPVAFIDFPKTSKNMLALGSRKQWQSKDWDDLIPELRLISSETNIYGAFAFRASDANGDWLDFPSMRFFQPIVEIIDKKDSCTVKIHYQQNAEQDAQKLKANIEKFPANSQSFSLPQFKSNNDSTAKDDFFRIMKKSQASWQTRCRKVVLSRQKIIEGTRPFKPAQICKRLRQNEPDCRVFAYRFSENTFLGASPERIISKNGNKVRCDILAGSAPRFRSSKLNNESKSDLLESRKIQQEHDIVKEQVLEKLQEFSDNINVQTRSIKTFKDIHHLHTPIFARLDKTHILDICRAIHPSPALCGDPQLAAMEEIAKAESQSRGWYAGALGFFKSNGSGEFFAGLRSGLISRERAILFAGAGILQQSDPEEEWHEMERKFQPMLCALGAISGVGR